MLMQYQRIWQVRNIDIALSGEPLNATNMKPEYEEAQIAAWCDISLSHHVQQEKGKHSTQIGS